MLTWNKVHDSITIFLGIFLEAIPFILLGVLLSAAIAVFIKPDQIAKIIPKNKFGGVLFATGLGFMFPVCECGNIPVARRLIKKKVKAYIAITFLLSAPVINPVVFAATYVAFKNNPEIIWFRYIMTFLMAATIGLLFSFVKDDSKLLKKSLAKEYNQPVAAVTEKKHKHHQQHSLAKTINEEFFEMAGVLTIGGFIASLVQLALPRHIVTALGQGPVTSVLAMSSLAFVTSICSNVDSFFALGFINNFSVGSILAFLILGPMLDIKAIIMMLTTFNVRTVIAISILVTQITFIFTLFYNLNIS